MKKKFIVALLTGMLAGSALAFEPFVVKDIRVDGIQRTEAGTVFSYLPVKVGETMTDEKAAQAIKALYATGFFKDVRIEIDRGIVVVVIEERPAIAQIDFVGLKEFDKEQIIKGLKEAGFAVSRSFDRSMLERAEQELKRQYLSRGLYSVTVTTTVTPLERNRVAINFNIEEGAAARIKQVNIVGAKSFKEKDLQAELQSSTTGWLSWYTKNDQYSRQKLSADLEALRSYYLNRGFLEFNIDSTQVSISPDKKDIYITVSVTEGERYLVSSVKLAGDLILPEEEFRKSMQIKAGDTFSREKLNESTKSISDKLSAKGYAFANVNAAPEIDKEKRQVAFTVFVDPGKRAYVRRINITGNSKTRDEVIRQEIRQMEGGWYDDERVKLSKQRIDKTDYFSEVTVETPPVPGTTDQVDVNFNVAEKTTGNVGLGLGYSQYEGVIVSASISQANIFGSGKFASLQLSTGKVNRVASIGYTNPYFTVDGISQGFDIYHKRSEPDKLKLGYAYATESTGGGIRFGIPIGEKQSLNFGAAIDYTDVTVDMSDDPSNLTPKQYKDFNKAYCGGSSSCGNYTLPLTASWISDGKDSVINPTKGAYQKLAFEVSPAGDLTYFKTSYQHQRFFALTKSLTLMLNGELGYAKGLGGKEVPFYKNFFAGGGSSVRGYEAASLGPYEIVTNSDDELRLGGTRRFVFNAELMMPVPGLEKMLRAGPFFDAGQVWLDRDDLTKNCVPGVACDQGPIRMSVGLAAAWASPLGPLKFSVGFPLNDQKSDKIQTFQFQMGQSF